LTNKASGNRSGSAIPCCLVLADRFPCVSRGWRSRRGEPEIAIAGRRLPGERPSESEGWKSRWEMIFQKEGWRSRRDCSEHAQGMFLVLANARIARCARAQNRLSPICRTRLPASGCRSGSVIPCCSVLVERSSLRQQGMAEPEGLYQYKQINDLRWLT
jgi:hypothetical protein